MRSMSREVRCLQRWWGIRGFELRGQGLQRVQGLGVMGSWVIRCQGSDRFRGKSPPSLCCNNYQHVIGDLRRCLRASNLAASRGATTTEAVAAGEHLQGTWSFFFQSGVLRGLGSLGIRRFLRI